MTTQLMLLVLLYLETKIKSTGIFYFELLQLYSGSTVNTLLNTVDSTVDATEC